MKKIFILLIATGMFYACSNNPGTSTNQDVMTEDNPQIDDNQMVIANDMENPTSLPSYWKNGISINKMDEVPAHSGNYAVKVDAESEYSITFRETFENLNAKLPKQVVVNGWYYFTEPNEKAGLIMEITDNGESYMWKSFNFAKVNPATNTWNEFTAYFSFDKEINPEQEISIFARGYKKVAYFDDLKVTFKY